MGASPLDWLFVWGGGGGGMKERWGSGLTEVSENLADGIGIGQKGDERERAAAGGADQGERLATNASRRCPRAKRAAHLEGREELGPEGSGGVGSDLADAAGWGRRG